MPDGPYPWSMYIHQWTRLPAAPRGNQLAGQTVIITGANSGLGLEVTRQLAALHPAKLILAVRTLDTGEKALATLKKKFPKLDAEVWFLDLMDIKSIKAFVERAQGLGRLDVLLNNAGINPNFSVAPAKFTADGYERVLQTNVLAPILMTLLLAPLLRKTAASNKSGKPRVIITGSDGHVVADHSTITSALSSGQSILEAFNDEKKYVNGERYFQTKLLLQMATRSLITMMPDMTIINVNPGLCRTNLGREFDLSPSFSIFGTVIWFLATSRSAEKGARNLSHAVVTSSDSVDYWSECGPAYSENRFLPTLTGMQATETFTRELLEEVEKISPGCTAVLNK